MKRKLQNLFNFVHDNLGKDTAVIGLSGLKRRTEYAFIEIPKEFKKTYITDIENNYLLL